MSRRRPEHRDPADLGDSVIHYWPGAELLHKTPSARPPCGARGSFGTPAPPMVTCRACHRFLASPLGASWPPAPWSRLDLAKFGLLDLSAPEPAPPAPPYRNPRLPRFDRDRPGPLASLAERVARQAEEARDAGQLHTFQALRSLAAELVNLHEESIRDRFAG